MKDNLKVILIDHDDSFTFNLRHWLFDFAGEVTIINHREVSEQNFSQFDLVVLSPGPKHPQDYPHILTWLNKVSPEKPIFGVCLGMQLMTISAGGQVESYSPPLHGKTSNLISGSNLNNLKVARYHSLKCSGLKQFDILAESDDLPMWIQHQEKKWMAVQFHPESFLTENSARLQHHIKDWI